MKRLSLPLLCTILLVACANFTPEAGVWSYASFDLSENGCNANELKPNSGDFEIRQKTDGTIEIDPKDGSDKFSCTVAGASVDCPDRAAGEKTIPIIQAKLKYNVSVKATMVDSKNGRGEQILVYNCEGTTCGALATQYNTKFPCTVKAKFAIAWKSILP